MLRRRRLLYQRARVLAGRTKSSIKPWDKLLISSGAQAIHNHIIRRARIATERRVASGKVRTLWASTPILILPILAKCDRLLGFRSTSLVYNTYYITKTFDINLYYLEAVVRLSRSGRAQGQFRRAILMWALLRFDIFHYFYDVGLLAINGRFGINPEELELLSAAGKRVYTYAYGADVRSRDITLSLGSPNLCQECPQPGKFCICHTEELDSSMKRLDGPVTAKIAMGDMVAYVPGCRNMHYWPLELAKFRHKVISFKKGDKLRVAHAPNHGFFKGTRFLEEAIERLQHEGQPIELVRVQGVPNEKVLELFRSCHVVADQFVAGFHGYTALEAMALGRPVLCFLRNRDMMIDPDTCPIINTGPDEIYDVLKKCLSGDIDLANVGQRSRSYVERYYGLEAVTARLGQLYIDTAELSEVINEKLTLRISELGRTVCSGAVPQ